MKKFKGLLVSALCCFGSVAATASTFALASCTNTDKVTIDEVYNKLVYSHLSSLSIDFKIYNELLGAKITYSSADANLISFDENFTMCYVHADTIEAKTNTNFTAHITLDGESKDKKFKVIMTPAGTLTTVADIVADTNEDGAVDTTKTYRIFGRYVADSGKGALIYDGTGYIYSYGSCTYDVGDYVVVDGKLSIYNGIAEFSSPTYGTYTPDEGDEIDITTGDPRTYTTDAKVGLWADSGDMAKYTGYYVKLVGKVWEYQKENSTSVYCNLKINGVDSTKYQASFVYNTSSSIDGLLTQYNTNPDYNSGSYTGDVEVLAYTLYKSGSTPIYMNVIPVEINPVVAE